MRSLGLDRRDSLFLHILAYGCRLALPLTFARVCCCSPLQIALPIFGNSGGGGAGQDFAFSLGARDLRVKELTISQLNFLVSRACPCAVRFRDATGLVPARMPPVRIVSVSLPSLAAFPGACGLMR